MGTCPEQDRTDQRPGTNGLYYLTEHALEEAAADGFDIYDVEYGILNGKIRKIRSSRLGIGRSPNWCGLQNHAGAESSGHHDL
jgi:hypothetical protein